MGKQMNLMAIDESIRLTKASIDLLQEVAPYNNDVEKLLKQTEEDLIVLYKVRDKLKNTEEKNE